MRPETIAWPPIAGDVETRLIRALLRTGQVGALPQDLIDSADLCLEADRGDLAAALYGAAALDLGFSGSFLAGLRQVNDRAGLWKTMPAAEEAARHGFSVDLAVETLARLIPLCGVLPEPDEIDLPRLDVPAASANPAPALAALATRARKVLRESVPASGDGRLLNLVRELAPELAGLPPLRIDAHIGLDLASLAGIVVLERLRIFTARNQALFAAAPADVFSSVARLPTDVLGPFFSNVRRLIRDVRDIFGLIDAAVGGRADFDTMTTWVVLLSAHLSAEQLAALTSELGDRGMVAALHGILSWLARLNDPTEYYGVAASIRDSCLDVDAFAVAERAQRLIVRWRAVDAQEWRRLGEIHYLCADMEGAKTALERAIALKPSDQIVMSQWGKLVAGNPLACENMVASRRHLRQTRLQAFRQQAELVLPGGG